MSVLYSSTAIWTKHQTVIFALSFNWHKKELLDVDYYEQKARKMWFVKNRAEKKSLLSSPRERAVTNKSNYFEGYVNKNLYCIQNSVTQTYTTTTSTSTPPKLPFAISEKLCIISNIKAKGTKLKITAQNMKQSRQIHTLLSLHKKNLHVQTDSRIYWNTKMCDTESGFCTNRAVGQQTARYQEFNTFNIPELNG